VPTSLTLYGFYSSPNISVSEGSFYFRDIILGAKGTGTGTIGSGGPGAVIVVNGQVDIYSGGIYFLGNSRLTNLPKAVAKGVSIIANSNYGTKNTQTYVGSYGQGRGLDVGVFFITYVGTNASPEGSVDRNLDTNCIHILDDNGNYGLMSNRAATDGSRGASLNNFVALLNQGSSVRTGGFASWHFGYTNTNKHHGMAGTFGNIDATTSGPTGVLYLTGTKYVRDASYTDSVWQMATSGTQLTSNATLTYAAGQSQASYTNSSDNPINLVVQAFYKGVDVTTATTVTGSMGTYSTYYFT
jgi:hypothetical protein